MRFSIMATETPLLFGAAQQPGTPRRGRAEAKGGQGRKAEAP